MIFRMARVGVISDEFWAVVEPLLPANGGRRGRPWNAHREVLEAICWRYRTGSPWRDLPLELGRWQTVWARHFRWSTDGTYDRVLTAAKSAGFLGAPETDAVVQLLSVDSTVVRAHQHATGAPQDHRPGGRLDDFGGHRGHRRTTRICRLNRLMTHWVAPEVVCPPRFTR